MKRNLPTITVQLSPRQMEAIWPGLDLIIKSFSKWKSKGEGISAYPLRIYPKPPEFDRGTFSPIFMQSIQEVWKKILQRTDRKSRFKMDTFQLRAAAFAVRVQLDLVRAGRRKYRGKKNEKDRAEKGIDDSSYTELKARKKTVIATLDRQIKQANRAMQKAVTNEEYGALQKEWEDHLRWMRIRIVYYKPWPKVTSKPRLRQQKVIDDLMWMAERGLRNEGYQPPDPVELRRVVKLYVASARRGREGKWDVHYLLERKGWFQTKRHLACWILDRLKLKKLSKP